MTDLNGAFEPSYIGPRVEIEGDRLTFFWRGAPSLVTTFTASQEGEKTVLNLGYIGLKNRLTDEEPYAFVTSCSYENDTLTVVKNYVISGESVDVMHRTENSIYGDVTVVDDILLPLIEGSWRADSFGFEVTFKDGKLIMNGSFAGEQDIICVKYNYDKSDKMYIRSKDPSVEAMFGLTDYCYENGRLTAIIPVCDAPSVTVEFNRI